MAIDWTIFFEESVGDLTPGTGETYCNGGFAFSDVYPVSRLDGSGLITIGPFGTDIACPTRTPGNPASDAVECCGAGFTAAGADHYLRVDLPTGGTTQVYTREGYLDGGAHTSQLSVSDLNGVLFTTPSDSVTAGNYRDANNNQHSAVDLSTETHRTVTVTANAGAYALLFNLTASSGTYLMSVRIVQAGAFIADETDGAQVLPAQIDEPSVLSVWG